MIELTLCTTVPELNSKDLIDCEIEDKIGATI